MRLVLDASYGASWFLPDEKSPDTALTLSRALANELELVVPLLWAFEILSILRMSERRKRLNESQTADSLKLLSTIPLQTIEQNEASDYSRILVLARQYELTPYDATYLALAEKLDAPLLSLDHALMRAARALRLPSASLGR